MMLTFHINIGPKVAACLQEIGINSLQELKDKGVAESYVEMSLLQPEKHLPLCYYLYSLEGAIEQINWRDLSKKRKEELKCRVQELQAKEKKKS